MVVAQIVVLDAVFSLDSVITAVGMVDNLGVMYAAVTIAMALMLLASKPLTRFVNKHPTVVVLCLGFLLMIGFSLVAEGLGYKIPRATCTRRSPSRSWSRRSTSGCVSTASATSAACRSASAPPMPCCACWARARPMVTTMKGDGQVDTAERLQPAEHEMIRSVLGWPIARCRA